MSEGKWTLEEVAEQAVVLYEGLRAQAVAEDDAQGENFWEGHRDTVLYALGRMPAIDAAVASAVGDAIGQPVHIVPGPFGTRTIEPALVQSEDVKP